MEICQHDMPKWLCPDCELVGDAVELQAENSKLKWELEDTNKALNIAYEAAKKSASDRETLLEVLRWYADKKNWQLGVRISLGSAFPHHEPIKSDKGERARAIIAKYASPEPTEEDINNG